ncbi:MAG: hypothetical protein WD230_02995 [Cucumibacter sp.]
MARIALILHRLDLMYHGLIPRPVYDITLTTRELARRGHKVFTVRDPRRFIPADAAILHVDCSVVPEAYLELASRYPRCLNGRCGDITKRHVSGAQIALHPTWAGPVIVKSNLNHGGGPERALNRHARWFQMATPFPGLPPPFSYRVFDRLVDVPESLGSDPDLVVEIFNPERVNGGYGVHSWQFMGDNGYVYFARGPDPVVRFSVAEAVEFRLLPDLEVERARIGLDFGKIDYILLDGKPLVIDANKTVGNASRPGWRAPDRNGEDLRSNALERALGIA